jgi:hypothetical protein
MTSLELPKFWKLILFFSKWFVWGRREMSSGFWYEDLREREYLLDLCMDGRLILKWILNLIHGGSFKWHLPDESLQFNLYLPKQTVLTTAMCIRVPNGQFCPVVDV